MHTVAQLVDQGVRAYVEGRLDEARRLLDEVLEREPGNARARSYSILLHGGLGPSAPRGAPRPPAPPELAPTSSAPFGAEEDYAPSPWDDGPATGTTIVIEAEGGMDLEAVAEKSDLRPLVPEATRDGELEAPQQPPAADGPERRGRDVDVWMAAAKDLHALGDFSGSLEMIEKILKLDPEHAEARRYLRENETTLVAMYESKLGPLGRVPRLAIKPEEVMWLNLDHRAGFLLSQVDGAVDYESLFALSGLPRLDTARILATLISDGVITS